MAVAVLVCACGRIGFDAQPQRDAAGDGVVPTMSRCHFRDVSAGRDHTCAIDGVGDVFCWGRTDRGQVVIGQAGYLTTPTKITLPRPAVQVEAGRDFSCARLDDNSLYCWGDNQLGQIGDGSLNNRKAPTLVALGDTALDIDSGTFHMCAIKGSDRSVACWGENQNFAVGDATADSVIRTPQVVPNTAGAIDLGIGHRHNCVALGNGEARCWGRGEYGQLATTGTVSRASADVAQNLPASVLVTAGGRHSCAVDGGGDLRCWGRNTDGELGRGTAGFGNNNTPGATVAGDVAQVAAGTSSTCVLLGDKRVQCWGSIAPGDGTYTLNLGPAAPALMAAEKISASYYHACAITTAGELRCWGDNFAGQLGRGTRGYSSSPVSTLVPVAASFVAAGGTHACAASAGGEVYCWGGNTTGELGTGTRNGSRTPLVVTTGLSAIEGMTAGLRHTCAWGAGVVVCWGDDSSNQIGINASARYQLTPVPVPGFTTVTQVAAGNAHNCAISNGAVNCWGANFAGQLGNNSTTDSTTLVTAGGTGGATQVCSGGDHSCAVIGGALKCWGSNADGELGDNTTLNRSTPISVSLSNVSQVACGGAHTCALDATGNVFCWGRNLAGENGQGDYTAGRRLPTQVTLPMPAMSITAGYGANCAKLVNGDTYCWGDGERGQLGNGQLASIASPTLAATHANAASLTLGHFGGCELRGTNVSCFGVTQFLGNGDTSDAVPTSPAFTCTE